MNETARKPDTLLHSARELVRVVEREPLQTGQLQELNRSRPGLGKVQSEGPTRDKHVVENGFPRQQRRLLEDHTHVTARSRNGRAVELDDATRCGNQTGRDTNEGRFPAPGRTEQGNKLPRPHRHRKLLDGDDWIAGRPVGDGNAIRNQHRSSPARTPAAQFIAFAARATSPRSNLLNSSTNWFVYRLSIGMSVVVS